MKKKNELIWNWNDIPTPLNKMSTGQLSHITKLVKTSYRKEWWGNKKKDILTEIDNINTNRDNYATKQAIDIIVKNRMNSINKAVDKFISSIYKLQIAD